jgi:hypothetical protein
MSFVVFRASDHHGRPHCAPWLCLIPGRNGVRGVDRAIELCRRHAYAGDPYSCYVLAWASVYAGRKEEALPMMEKAAAAGFPPVSVGLITFTWTNLRDLPQLAAELLDRADRSGHKAAVRHAVAVQTVPNRELRLLAQSARIPDDACGGLNGSRVSVRASRPRNRKLRPTWIGPYNCRSCW